MVDQRDQVTSHTLKVPVNTLFRTRLTVRQRSGTACLRETITLQHWTAETRADEQLCLLVKRRTACVDIG